MTLQRRTTDLLLRPEDITPSSPSVEVVGVFNPGVVRFDDRIVLLLRVAERPRDARQGWLALPRIEDGHLIIDWEPEQDYQWVDPRVVRRREDGIIRLTFVSHLLIAWSRDGRTIEQCGPTRILPQHEWEEYGVEDPRITPIGADYLITYVAVSRHGAATALARTRDFESFERLGIIFPPENKDVVLFPEKVQHQYLAIHRPNGATRFTIPEMWLAASEDLRHWGDHRPLPVEAMTWQSGRVGAGTPPILLAGGWLEIYHGNERPTRVGDVGCYTAGALLLDRNEPWRITHRSCQPLLAPVESFERTGFVSDVVFPTGIVEGDDSLFVYYGAADKYTAVVQLATKDVLAAMNEVEMASQV